MKTFHDKNKQAWNIELNVGTARRVRAECGVDLINAIEIPKHGEPLPSEPSVIERLFADPILLVSVLFSLCKNQVQERETTDEEFAEGFDATTVQEACDALMEEIINFSQPAKKKLLCKIYQKAQAFAGETEEQMDKILQSPEFDQELDNQLKKLYTATQES